MGGSVGADHAFCLVSFGWYLSYWVVSFVYLLDSVVYAGLEFGDCCLVVDLVDLDLLGNLMSGGMSLVTFSCWYM